MIKTPVRFLFLKDRSPAVDQKPSRASETWGNPGKESECECAFQFVGPEDAK